MKRKRIEAIPILLATRKSKKIIIKAKADGDYLLLDLFREGEFTDRYVIDTETGEHADWTAEGSWNKRKFIRVLGFNPLYNSVYEEKVKKCFVWDTEEDEETAEKMMGTKGRMTGSIDSLEDDYDKEKRVRAKERKFQRIDKMMEEIPEEEEGFREWIYGTCCKERYLFYDKTEKAYGCSNCGQQIPEKVLNRPKQGETVQCPECQEKAVVKKRSKSIWTKIRVLRLQRIKPEYGIARHYMAEIEQTGNGHKVYLDEGVRIILYNKGCDTKGYDIFYNQDGLTTEWWSGMTRPNWYTSNTRNKRTGLCFLYPEEIQEALKGTGYESIANAFEEMAKQNMTADYNAAMAAGFRSRGFGQVMEYLSKGRFYRLCRETTEKCEAYSGFYRGSLVVGGKTMEEVMGLDDKQKINRIREEDRGYLGLEWMRYSEKHRYKIPSATMDYLEKNRIDAGVVERLPGEISTKMSPERIVNYIKSQVGKPYQTPEIVLEQWTDYLAMCEAQEKSLEEELFYKPKDLKRRHDQLVADRQKLEIVKRMEMDPEMRQQEARKMEEKFPAATAVMKEVKEKYEYAAEGYCMIMPKNPIEIVKEGFALHHCAGSSERYFNRIENRETFIGFLRREEEPKIPFYTIEFEPGGTIRQSRSYYDEEPGIEEIRGFLKLWQKEIKKRMTKEDREHAKRSAVLREENIKELQENKNQFVLKKLMEDFMEAV